MRTLSRGASTARRAPPIHVLLPCLALFANGPAMANPADPAPGTPSSVSPPATPRPQASEEPRTGRVVRVTWAEVVALVERHPSLGAARLELAAARHDVAAARAAPNPQLEGNLGEGVARASGETRLEWGLALTMPLGWLLQRDAVIGAAEASVGVAAAEAAALRRDVLLELRVQFWGLTYEQARLAALEALAAQTAELARTVARRVASGEARPVEQTRVEIELERVMAEVESSRTALEARRAELALWLGVPSGATVVPAADLAALPAPMRRETAVAAARERDPSVALAEARAQALAMEVRVQRAARAPAIALGAYTDHELDRRAYGGALTVDLPFGRGGSARIAGAEARKAAGRQRAEAARMKVEAAVVEAQAACAGAVATATRYRDALLPRSESAALTLERTYQLGESTLLDVIDARRTLLEAHRLYLSALAQSQIDCSHLDALVGEASR
jgi:cobalt-zinc-cadmium efflux system outer membrane protein